MVCKTTVFVQQGVCAPPLTSSLPTIISNPGKTFPHTIQRWADRGILQDFQKSLVITGTASVKSCVAGGFPCLRREQRCALGEEESFGGSVLMELNLSRRKERDPGPGCLLGGQKKLLGIWYTWFFSCSRSPWCNSGTARWGSCLRYPIYHFSHGTGYSSNTAQVFSWLES